MSVTVDHAVFVAQGWWSETGIPTADETPVVPVQAGFEVVERLDK